MNNLPFTQYGIRFDFIFPNFGNFQAKFLNTSVPINDPEMYAFYNLIAGKYNTRYFRWANEEQIIGNITPQILDKFFKFKFYNQIYKETTLETLVNSKLDDYLYGLPADEEEITDANQNKYINAKSRKNAQPSKLEALKTLDKVKNMMEDLINEIAIWFISGFTPIGVPYQPLPI